MFVCPCSALRHAEEPTRPTEGGNEAPKTRDQEADEVVLASGVRSMEICACRHAVECHGEEDLHE